MGSEELVVVEDSAVLSVVKDDDPIEFAFESLVDFKLVVVVVTVVRPKYSLLLSMLAIVRWNFVETRSY